jgi:hypothetical protein
MAPEVIFSYPVARLSGILFINLKQLQSQTIYKYLYIDNSCIGQAPVAPPVILATQEAESGGLRFKVSPDK